MGLYHLCDKDRRPREAMELVNRAVELYPTHADGYALRAGFEADRKQYERAEEDFAEAIRLSPEDPSLYLARAQFFTRLKRSSAAREDTQKAARLGATAEEIAGALGMKAQ